MTASGGRCRAHAAFAGVTLWEMISGKLPFQGSAAELMYQHQHATLPVEKLKGVPVSVVALLEVLVAKDPATVSGSDSTSGRSA